MTRKSDTSADRTAEHSVRLDKWLWAARFFKTRTLAAAAVDAGKVRAGRQRLKPACTVAAGLALDIETPAGLQQIVVTAASERRGSASDAAMLYRETDASLSKRLAQAEQRRLQPEPSIMLSERPTKRDRRQLQKLHLD